ncbi:hypothetical protein [Bacillus solimangrovi]|uniref:Uncharacterized protein n=1 Tax=Bacillus solimangrovi TaxID=1305675 RepID=A0A1E5LD47_9BACI|nr:hypothetical protein [Bacillus solimangrovi]OEH92002.1 hypothetical protein BFG57_17205 [Bacillus solimangrovi]
MDVKRIKRLNLEQFVISNMLSILMIGSFFLIKSYRVIFVVGALYFTVDLLLSYYKSLSVFEILFPRYRILGEIQKNKLGEEYINKKEKQSNWFLFGFILLLLLCSVLIKDKQIESIDKVDWTPYVIAFLIINFAWIRDYRIKYKLSDKDYQTRTKKDSKILLVIALVFSIFSLLIILLFNLI